MSSNRSNQVASTGLCYLMCAEIPGDETVSDTVATGHEVYYYECDIRKPVIPGYNGHLNASARVLFGAITIIMDHRYTEAFSQKCFSGDIFAKITLLNLKNTGVNSTGKPSFRLEVTNAKIVEVTANVDHLVTTQNGEKISALKDPNLDLSTPDHVVKSVKIAIVGDTYTWTYFPYDEKGAAQGNIVAAFDVHTNTAPGA
ncbi:MAG: hypothetical protein A2977_03515 [Alphaproteobacteria bacterium RIFCSPLOWO2_01_FULL_45_8]|nr:MAG: hypothetical protein A3K20_00425 [Alphaproteobacteria bacterium GWA1_45_9]OFW89718.1 MAG: hypothetical protein A2621_02315 [Alphaproteobacteria bacterium RIFCSPHIGHO2_01_FULL_41_14]OFW96102.1 MAG: hypothetical protein A2977_03515 [Alphaproteobacteria bacterium RIFCSPLOWO2_01_FULL_45_8]HCI49163.1 hypothetical protein [Holosporales bacterium]